MATDKSFGCRFANTEKCADSCFKCELFHRDYISREAIRAVFQRSCDECKDTCLDFDGFMPDCEQCPVHTAQSRIEALPAADVRPVVRGKWLEPDDDYGYLMCSACEERSPNDERWRFCPNCGADMREVGTE